MKKEYLLSPGPTPVPPEALQVMAEPMFHHRTPRFRKMFQDVTEGLQEVFCTKSDVITLFGSGTSAMEACVVNAVDAGEKALVIRGGKFGERWGDICEAYGIAFTAIDPEWGTAGTPEQVAEALKADPSIVAVFTTLVETSTGVLTDIQGMGEVVSKTDALLVVDGISGVGAVECRVDAWHIDMLAVGSQKALMIPPGLAYVSVSDKAWKKIEATKRGCFYLDLLKHRKALGKWDPAFTPPVTLFAAQQKALEIVRKEGIENVWKRVKQLGAATRAAVEAMGLETYSQAPADCLTTVKMPEGVDGDAVVKDMRDVQGVTPAGGQAHLKGKIIRLASMGYVNHFDIIIGLTALAGALRKQNVKVDLGAAVDTFMKELG
ncbi:MAG TPA: alanine--glyoxylate aminotransferase family protein [Planctomycetota bacterium]|nr:alanine--glyoxylate aminotransferase family protein [Planctomycetota bacterium]